MAPTFAHGKICYIEMPATDISRSAEFYQQLVERGNQTRPAFQVPAASGLRYEALTSGRRAAKHR